MISKQGGGVWMVLDDLTHSFAQNEAFIFSFCLCNLVRKYIFITYWCGLCFIVTYLTNAYKVFHLSNLLAIYLYWTYLDCTCL